MHKSSGICTICSDLDLGSILIINRISALCLHDVRFTFEEKKYQFKETNEDLLLLNIYFNEKKVHLDEQGEEKRELTLP